MAKLARISGLMLDTQGYRVSPEINSLELWITQDGKAWDDFRGTPSQEQITRNQDGTLDICGGSFNADAWELSRLSRDYGCKL